jgi:cysteine-rich repeat protein
MCIPPTCGDGVREGDEECDDGNTVGGDGCSPVCALIAISEVEPNDDGSPSIGGDLAGGNDFSSAMANGPYSADVILSASFGVPGDEDVFAITNSGGTSRTVRLETFSGVDFGGCSFTYDTVLNIRDAAGTLLDRDDNDGPSLCSAIDVTLAPGETVYVHVTDWGDNGTYPYYLTVDFL